MVIPMVDYTPNRPLVNHELEPADVRWRVVAPTRPVRLCAGCRDKGQWKPPGLRDPELTRQMLNRQGRLRLTKQLPRGLTMPTSRLALHPAEGMGPQLTTRSRGRRLHCPRRAAGSETSGRRCAWGEYAPSSSVPCCVGLRIVGERSGWRGRMVVDVTKGEGQGESISNKG
jgi:hypothetical protein